MKCLVGIQGHAGNQEAIECNGRHWLNGDQDLVGLNGEDSPATWPNFVVGVITSPIREGKWLGYGFRPTLLIDSIMALRNAAHAGKYDSILWTEADAIFLNSIPQFNRAAFNCTIAGYCPPEWNCGTGAFLHPPFLMSLDVADQWCAVAGSIELEQGNGTPDVIAAMICKKAGIPILQLDRTYSCNGLDMRLATKMKEARVAMRAGAWHIHGIKRKDHQDYILGKTDAMPADTL